MEADSGASGAGIGLVGRMVRVLYAPGETFTAVQQRCSRLDWFAPALLTALVATAGVQISMPLVVKAQQEAVAKVQADSRLSAEQQAQQRQLMAKMSGLTRAAVLASTPVMTFAMVFIAGAVLLAVGRFALGGEVAYGQMLAVAGYASLIGVVQTAWMTPLRQFKGTMVLTLGPGLLLKEPMLSSTFAGRWIGAIDVFVLWQVGVAAVGLAVLSRASFGKALACLLVLWALFLAGVALLGGLFGGGPLGASPFGSGA